MEMIEFTQFGVNDQPLTDRHPALLEDSSHIPGSTEVITKPVGRNELAFACILLVVGAIVLAAVSNSRRVIKVIADQ